MFVLFSLLCSVLTACPFSPDNVIIVGIGDRMMVLGPLESETWMPKLVWQELD